MLALILFSLSPAWAQQSSAPQPLNAAVSDFGTTYIFSPPPICARCVETEFGFASLQDTRTLPTVFSFAPFKTPTDINVLVNLLDSESSDHHRVTQFGNRIDFIVRQQVLQHGILTLSVAPRGAVFLRDASGGRAGLTAAPQISKGNNLYAANFTLTGAIGVSAANPRSDYVGDFDYFRTLDHRGTAFFLGLQNEFTGGQQTVGTEAGLIIPFRSGQVEFASQQVDLAGSLQWQFQTRVITNWGKVFPGK